MEQHPLVYHTMTMLRNPYALLVGGQKAHPSNRSAPQNKSLAEVILVSGYKGKPLIVFSPTQILIATPESNEKKGRQQTQNTVCGFLLCGFSSEVT